MKILNFIKALLPKLERNDVIEDLRVTIAELDSTSIPSFKAACEFFRINKYKSDILKSLSNTFYTALDPHGISKQNTFMHDIRLRLENVKDNAEYVSEQIEALFELDIVNNGLTAKKALLLRTAGDISFITKYSTDLLNYIYVMEAAYIGNSTDANEINNFSIKYIESNYKQFVFLLSDIGMDNKKFKKMLGSVPEVIITEDNTDSIKAVYRDNELDPMDRSHIRGFTNNPIYHLGIMLATWQANRFKAAKNKKKLLELRILNLKMILEDQQDAKLEKEIIYNQSRLDKVNRQITEMENG